jgi:hypothetical protein
MRAHRLHSIAFACVTLFLAGPVQSRVPSGDPGPGFDPVDCSLSNLGGGAIDCVGWYGGNLNALNTTAYDKSAAALNDLLGVNSFTGAGLTWLEDRPAYAASLIDFTTPLYGLTVVAFHVDEPAFDGPGVIPYDGTAFYLFNAGNNVGGLDSFTFNVPNLHGVRLYSTGAYVAPPPPTSPAPEPTSWALMVAGFGMAGGLLRYRRPRARVAQG